MIYLQTLVLEKRRTIYCSRFFSLKFRDTSHEVHGSGVSSKLNTSYTIQSCHLPECGCRDEQCGIGLAGRMRSVRASTVLPCGAIDSARLLVWEVSKIVDWDSQGASVILALYYYQWKNFSSKQMFIKGHASVAKCAIFNAAH